MRESSLWGIVLAGGQGRRLREVTRIPKQFARFGGDESLLQRTVRRLLPLIPGSRVVVVVGRGQERLAARQLSHLPEAEILAQPADRGTAAGVLLPLTHVKARDPSAVVALTPSDHGVADGERWRASLRAAHRAVDSGAAPAVLFGAEPDSARDDYGWVVPGRRLPHGLRTVASFVEKPPPERARRLLENGAVWSTMTVVARVKALFDRFRKSLPAVAELFHAARESPTLLPHVYERIPARDFSRDVLQRADDLALAVWPRSLGWTDLGTPERLAAWQEAERREYV